MKKNKKALVFYSGGKGSFISAYLAKGYYGENNVSLYFNDTQNEDPDLYRFLHESADKLNLPLIEDSDGRDIWQVFEDEKFIGNSRVDICSRVLKRDRSKSYVFKHIDPNDTDLILGIGVFESHRIERAIPHWIPYNMRSILFDHFVDEEWILPEICNELQLRLPSLYDRGFKHNNCGGFCVKSGLAGLRMLYKQLPERYLFHENREILAMANNSNLRPFIKKSILGTTIYLTMKQYRQLFLEQEVDLDNDEKFDFGSCACAI